MGKPRLLIIGPLPPPMGGVGAVVESILRSPLAQHWDVDVFNLLNAQRPILVDQRWSFQQADNSSPVPTNPNYGKAVLRTAPTTARFGVRISF